MTRIEALVYVVAFIAVAAITGATDSTPVQVLGYAALVGLAVYGLVYGRRSSMTWREWFGGGWRQQ